MNLHSKFLLASVLVLSFGIVSCGGLVTLPATGLDAGLNGNWNLVGDRQLKQYPELSTTLTVSGNQITGGGDMAVRCAGSSSISLGGSMSLSGQIAADGTFHLTEPLLDSIQVTIDGGVPAKGSTTWSGTYTIADAAGYTGCGVNQKGSFTATAFAPMNGTYAGAIAGVALGSGASMSTQISQVAPMTIHRADGSSVTLYPLDAAISVQGSPCFKQGTTSGSNFSSTVSGDFVNLSFNMDDGSQLLVNGWMNSSETSIQPVVLTVFGGQCAHKSSGTVLSLQ